MEILISAMLPIALVALVGFGVGRKFDLDMQTLARVNIYALLPALVLTSLAQTTLAGLRPGAAVNLEQDMIGRWVEALVGGGR